MQTNEELIVKAKNGDEYAKELLFEQNQPFIFKTAYKYQNVAEIDDLVSIGNIGLLKAYNAFDINKGIKFITYYARIVVNEILIYFRNTKKFKNEISIERLAYANGEGNDLTIFDMQEDEEAYNKFSDYEKSEVTEQVLKMYYTNENQNMIDVLNLTIIKGLKQGEASSMMNLSQAQICRLRKKVLKRLNAYYQKVSPV